MSVMDMSDEDLANMTEAQIDELIAKEEAEAASNAGNEEVITAAEDQNQEADDNDGSDTAPENQPEEIEQPTQEAGDESGKVTEATAATAEGSEGGQEGTAPVEKPATTEPVERDYKTEVSKILAPFKANGRQIQVDNVDDAIQLMQQGANYHKKMEGLKPRLATLKLLEREGLLEGDKLNYLIDLAKGDKGAINRLVKEHSVDTLEIDGSKADQYKSNQYQVSDSEVELDNVISDLRESTHYPQLMDVVGNKWDNASHKALAEKPEQLRDIHRHMELGVFDKVQDRVATERALGKLNGLSSLEAYRNVGERMYQEGQFNGGSTATTSAQPKVVAVKSAPKTAPVSDESKKKKLAASPSGSKSVVKVEEEFDPLNMSDEDFIKNQAKFNIR